MIEERVGDIWELHEAGSWITVTTNGFVKRNGEAVMGRGIAAQAKARFPGLAAYIGHCVSLGGNVPFVFPMFRIITFPVKHVWWDPADLDLIRESCHALKKILRDGVIPLPVTMTKPGCHNGRLAWADVKPVLNEILSPEEVVICDIR